MRYVHVKFKPVIKNLAFLNEWNDGKQYASCGYKKSLHGTFFVKIYQLTQNCLYAEIYADSRISTQQGTILTVWCFR